MLDEIENQAFIINHLVCLKKKRKKEYRHKGATVHN